MVILKIWFSEYPWDVRVEKILESLVNGGHQVHLLSRNNFGHSLREQGDGFVIHRLPYVPGPRGKRLYTLTKLLNLPYFCNPIWIYKIYTTALKYDVDLLMVRDLPLTLPAILVAKLLGKRVMFDMAECHPEIFKNYFRWSLKSLLVENPWVAPLVERLTIRYVDHILVMCEESMARLSGLGVDKARMSVVSNTTRIVPHRKMQRQQSDEIRMIYVGMVSEMRGLDTVIDAMPILLGEHRLNIYFDVLGNVGSYLEVVKARVTKMGLGERVVFHGWIDNRDISKYIDDADIGVLPLWKMSHYDVTIANKLFDYMACSVPVLCSDTTAMARIVRETDCGLVFRERNVDDFVSCVVALKDAERRAKCGENGRIAIETTYNWSESSRQLDAALRACCPGN